MMLRSVKPCPEKKSEKIEKMELRKVKRETPCLKASKNSKKI
jgi:hypothetical protein